MKKPILKRVFVVLLTAGIIAGASMPPVEIRAEETEAEPSPTVTACGEIVNTWDNYAMGNIIDGKMSREQETWACNQNHGTAGEHWFEIDFHKARLLSSYTIYHQGAYNGQSHFNTVDYDVKGSLDGQEWDELASVTGNTENQNTVSFAQPKEIRYIRVEIKKSAVNGNTTARIPEMSFVFNETKVTVDACGEIVGGSDNYSMGAIIDGEIIGEVHEWACNKQHGTPGHHYFTIDLGEEKQLNYYILYHHGAYKNGESYRNTRSYTVSVSNNNSDWETVETVEGNTDNIRRYDLETGKTVRYVKVDITAPTTNSDNTARLPEMKLFGDDDINLITGEKEQVAKHTVALYSALADGKVISVANLSGGGSYGSYSYATVRAEEKEGYAFKGWYKVNDVTETAGQITNIAYDETPVSTDLECVFQVQEETRLAAVYEATGGVTLRVKGSDVNVNDEPVSEETGYEKKYEVGASVTLNYNGEGVFLYWKNSSDKIVSKEKEYTFTIVSDTDVTAVLGDGIGETGAVYVEFISAYNQVMEASIWNTSDAETAHTLPAGPSKLGGTFQYWSLDGTTEATVASILGAIPNHEGGRITVVPVYQETGTTYTVTVKYPDNAETVTFEEQSEGAGLTLAAKEIQGKKFSHWSDKEDGSTILSYSESYFIRVSKNITLYAIYGDTEVEKTPTIAMTNQYASTVDGKNKVSFEATRDIPEGYELLEHGILFTTNGEAAKEDALVVGGAGVSRKTSNDAHVQGVYTLNISVGENTETIIYARGYMTVMDMDGTIETIYTSIASGSYENMTN